MRYWKPQKWVRLLMLGLVGLLGLSLLLFS